jgi:phosphoribosyl 1,2-cyclic phosphate phosphodiesterase
VIYTHEHADQTNGIFELRPFYWKNKKKIDIYGNKKTINLLKKRFDYCFKKTRFYPPIIKANIINEKFSLGKFDERVDFNFVKVRHGNVKSMAYIFENTAYISDCNDLSIIKNNKLKNLKYLIIDCLKIKNNFAHFNLKESIYVHNQLKPKKTILTNLHADLDYNFLLKRLPKNVYPAYDGLKLSL